MSKNARETALIVLEGCRRNSAFSDSLLTEVLKTSELDPRDRALATRLSMGVLQNRILLDYYIDSLAGGRNLEPKLRDILRLSLYQLVFMDRIPAHAAVSEGVELCRRRGLARACGLVNALLRKASGNEGLPPLPEEGSTRYLSVKYSVPENLAELLTEEFGYAFACEFLSAGNEPAPVTLMANTLKTTAGELVCVLEAEGVSCRGHDFLENCVVCDGLGDITALESFKRGLFYVQDPAAYMAVMAAGAAEGQSVLDACSAPGGKSFAAALSMKNKGSIVSCDIHENKLSRVKKGAERLGIDLIETRLMDASAPLEQFREGFDLVIADVPCSGLGVLRKKPDIRFKDTESMKNLPEVQLRILEGLCSCVKKGGTLLYSTCTILDRENGKVIAAFLQKHPEFTPENFSLPCPEGASTDGMITMYPNVQGTDGFFICKLRKSNES